MQVENKEINGFLIDEFNQYGLEVGKTQGICPLCSHTRKPKNQKLKCSSYDWERGLGTCHNCIQLINYTLTNVRELVNVNTYVLVFQLRHTKLLVVKL